jgi:electron transport complex protein RnfD
LYWAGKVVKPTLQDMSAVLSGWLIAMTLPPWAPWWIGVVGAALAIIIGKHVYGGLGQNLFNPAMLARVGLLIAFPVEMTTWAEPQRWFSPDLPSFIESVAITFSGIDNIDAVSGATLLGHVKTELSQNHLLPDSLNGVFNLSDVWLGLSRGSLAEGCLPLLLLGGFWLLHQGVIRWYVPVSLLSTVLLLATVFYLYDSSHYLSPLLHIGSGALMLTAFFIATDYVTSPQTPLGQLIFGCGCGLLIFVIRTWGAYPEGAGFAVLLMNSVTPLIDHYIRPRIYGRDNKGKPLEVVD